LVITALPPHPNMQPKRPKTHEKLTFWGIFLETSFRRDGGIPLEYYLS
jgi:hypothetical protein